MRPVRTFALHAVLLLHRHRLVRVQDRVRETKMLREQQKRTHEPEQSSFDGR
jgi:hypothetical protein